MWMQTKQAWSQLAQREQQMVLGLGIFLILVLLYLLIWSPIHNGYAQAQKAEQKAAEDWRWLSEQVQKHPMQQRSEQTLQFATQSQLMGSIQKTLRDENLLGSMESLTPSAKAIKVSFKEVHAPRFFRWLSSLEKQGLVSSQLQVTPVKTGIIQASVSFEVAN